MHKRHLTNGIEDIDHILRFCVLARNLWAKVVRLDDLQRFLTSSFDDWSQQLIEECKRVCASMPARGFSSLTNVVLNVVADKLAALEHALNRNGSLYAAPPGMIMDLVDEEHACWEASEVRGESTLADVGLHLYDAALSSDS
ncbi:hypothetical protein V6N13_120821 [Hibiscus sabdariffa]